MCGTHEMCKLSKSARKYIIGKSDAMHMLGRKCRAQSIEYNMLDSIMRFLYVCVCK